MGKFIKFLLVCLGFKSLTACEVFYGTDEYGTPYAEYEAKGRVSDALKTIWTPLPSLTLTVVSM